MTNLKEMNKEMNKGLNNKEMDKMNTVLNNKENKRAYTYTYNNVTKVTEENVKNGIVPELKNDADYMRWGARIHGAFSQADQNIKTGPLTVDVETKSLLLYLSDEKLIKIAHKALDNCKFINETVGKVKNMTGTGKYCRVIGHDGTMDNKPFKLVLISKPIEEAIIQQLKYIDINDAENLRNLLRDLNDCGRMYQELTLDAAKKLYEVRASFYQEFVRAESTIHLDHTPLNFKKLAAARDVAFGEPTDKFEIFRNNYYGIDRELEIGECNVITKKDGGAKKMIVKDHLADIQNEQMFAVEHAVNEDGVNAFMETKLSDETVLDLDLTGETGKAAMDMYEATVKPLNKAIAIKAQKLQKLYEIKNLSNKDKAARIAAILNNPQLSQETKKAHIDEINRLHGLSDFEVASLEGRYQDEYDEIVDRLSNLARFYTKDLSIVEAGRIMFAASNISINARESKAVLKDNASSAYMHIAPELGFAYITAMHADMKVCGYKLLGSTDQVNEGDVIEFASGNAVGFDNLYIDDYYDGMLRVETVNGVLSAVVDIVELLEANRIPPITPDKISLRIYEGSTLDCEHFAKTGEVKRLGSHELFDRQRVFEKATSITLHPVYRYTDNKGKERRLFNAIVASVPSAQNPNELIVVPACSYLCYSSLFENVLAGFTFTDMNKNNTVDGKTAWATVEYGDNAKYVEVEKRLSVQGEILNTGNVDDFDISIDGLAATNSVVTRTNDVDPFGAAEEYDTVNTNTANTTNAITDSNTNSNNDYISLLQEEMNALGFSEDDLKAFEEAGNAFA